jgi:hypothetical protein
MPGYLGTASRLKVVSVMPGNHGGFDCIRAS